jgi:subtilisin-like proprotein convertase family protein
MHSMSSNSSRPAVESQGISRRTLVKGAAHAAWVVPAVQVVSAVPAFAASCGIKVSGSASNPGKSGKLTVTLTIEHTGLNTLSITLAPSGMSNISWKTQAGWQRTGDTGGTVTYTWTGSSSIPNPVSATFTADATKGNNPAVTATISASSSAGTCDTPPAYPMPIA